MPMLSHATEITDHLTINQWLANGTARRGDVRNQVGHFLE
jgi:hypothetical protein